MRQPGLMKPHVGEPERISVRRPPSRQDEGAGRNPVFRSRRRRLLTVEPGETDRPARGSVDATGHRGRPTQTKVLHIRGLVVTWLLRHRVAGCICRLQIDEAETSGMVELE